MSPIQIHSHRFIGSAKIKDIDRVNMPPKLAKFTLVCGEAKRESHLSGVACFDTCACAKFNMFHLRLDSLGGLATSWFDHGTHGDSDAPMPRNGTCEREKLCLLATS